MSYLGENIRSFRKSKGLTISELSALCKSSVSSISQIENGKRDATFKVILKIADALEIDVSELVISPEKEKFHHHFLFIVKFDDFTCVGGSSVNRKGDLIKWIVTINLSSGEIKDLSYYNPININLSSEKFLEQLTPYLIEERLGFLVKGTVIKGNIEQVKIQGITWNDFTHAIINTLENI